MADSEDDYDNSAASKRRGKFRKERDNSAEGFKRKDKSSAPVRDHYRGSNDRRERSPTFRGSAQRQSGNRFNQWSNRSTSPARYQQEHYPSRHYDEQDSYGYKRFMSPNGSSSSQYHKSMPYMNHHQSPHYPHHQQGPYFNRSNSPPHPAFYDDDQSHKKLKRDWSALGEMPKTTNYFEHDNRLAPDGDEDFINEDYNRLNRPSNYSSYRFDGVPSNPNFPVGAATKNGFNNFASQMPHPGNGFYGNHFPNQTSNPYLAQANTAQAILNTMTPIVSSNNQYASLAAVAAAAVVNNLSATNVHMFKNGQQPLAGNNFSHMTQFNSKFNSNDRYFNGNNNNNNNNNGFDGMGQTQPHMLSFKQFLANLHGETGGDPAASISPEVATKRYNDYKNAFRLEQIAQFFGAHKREEWFKQRYHPDDSARRKDEQRDAIQRRLNIFLQLMDKYNQLEHLSLDMSDPSACKSLYKFLDACMIKLEDGSDEDLQLLDKIYDRNSGVIDAAIKRNELDVKEQLALANKNGKHKLSDEESGVESNSDEEEEQDDELDEAGNQRDDPSSKFDRKKKNKRLKKRLSKVESPPDSKPSNEIVNEPKSDPAIISETENKETNQETIKLEAETKKPAEMSESVSMSIPQKTQSIFFKHLPVIVTRHNLEEIGKRFPGFKRASISEPAPERRFQRRGWITFDSTVNIKDICSKMNGIKLFDMMLNATINRELEQKVKYIIGLTNHKTIVRNDLKLIARIVENMDKRWGLWQHMGTYTNNKLNDEEFKTSSDKRKSKENKTKRANDDVEINEEENQLSNQTSDTNQPPLKQNPLVEAANEYLTYLHENNEEDRPQEAADGDKPTTISLNKAIKLETDPKAAKLLDKLILYLRIVHSIDYYNATEYQQEDWMPNRCGVLHVRGSIEQKSSYNSNITNILNGMNINYFDPLSIKKVQIDEWLRLFDQNIRSYVDYRDRIELEVAKRLGLKELNVEIEKFISANCQKVEKDIWLCPLSGKKFKGADYVKKHIETKHRDKLLELRKEVEFFNRFVYDPKRPYLPEHPFTKNMGNVQPIYPDYQQANFAYQPNNGYNNFNAGQQMLNNPRNFMNQYAQNGSNNQSFQSGLRNNRRY